MSLSQSFKTNPEKEISGVVVEYGEMEPGRITSFLISRMSRSNKKYTKGLEKATRPHRRSIELETLNNDVADNVFMSVFVDTVLLDWKNVLNSDVTGDANQTGYAEFTKDNAISLFKNLPELYEDLQDKAKKASLFRDETMEDEAKN